MLYFMFQVFYSFSLYVYHFHALKNSIVSFQFFFFTIALYIFVVYIFIRRSYFSLVELLDGGWLYSVIVALVFRLYEFIYLFSFSLNLSFNFTYLYIHVLLELSNTYFIFFITVISIYVHLISVLELRFNFYISIIGRQFSLDSLLPYSIFHFHLCCCLFLILNFIQNPNLNLEKKEYQTVDSTNMCSQNLTQVSLYITLKRWT